MGIIYNIKIGKSYKTNNSVLKLFSQSGASKVLTRQNEVFLKSLGLRLRYKKEKSKTNQHV